MKTYTTLETLAITLLQNGTRDIQTLTNYIDTYVEVFEVDRDEYIQQLTDEANYNDVLSVNGLIMLVQYDIVSMIGIECDVDTEDFELYTDGCASSINYLGDNNKVESFMFDNNLF